MKWKRNAVVASMLLVALVLGCGGAGGYGKLRVEDKHDFGT
jgi:hypothetical protein